MLSVSVKVSGQLFLVHGAEQCGQGEETGMGVIIFLDSTG